MGITDDINDRFLKAYKKLKEEGEAPSQSDIARYLGKSPASITEIMKGRNNVGVDVLHYLFKDFNLSPDYIFFGKGDIKNERDKNESTPNLSTQSTPKGQNTKNERYKNQPSASLIQEPSVITPDDGKSNIVMLSSKAAAGLPANLDNVEYFNAQPHFHFPSLPDVGVPYISIEADGDSMHPTVKHRDWVIGERLLDLNNLKEGYVHIIVTTEGTAIKRLLNRIEQRKKVVCKSDNWSYPTYEVEIADVLAIYRAKYKFSADFANLNAQEEIRRDIEELKRDMELLKGKM